ncbi:tenascin-X [Rhinophrynus dorsalis]
MSPFLSLILLALFIRGSFAPPPTTTDAQCPDGGGIRALLKRLEILEKLVRDIKGQCKTPCCDKVQTGADDPASVKAPPCPQSTESCPGGCGGESRGTCVDGQCQCKDGYMGDMCQLQTCPEDCNDQGRCVMGRCYCFDGYFGVDCGSKRCPNDCHNHGRCEDGQCVCDPGFTGEDCSSKTCPKNCRNRGRCEDGVCFCDSDFTGPDCGSRTCPRNCLSQGICDDGFCVCNPGFTGLDCGSRTCPNDCQDNGRCEDGVCICDYGFTGVDCSTKTCPNDCQNQGRCIDGFCVCDFGFSGLDCGIQSCPEDCNEQGRCISGVCVCDAGFIGPDCGTRVCSPECERRGRCEDGECICNPGFTGPDCEIRTCPNDCHKQGRCEDGKCVCDSGFTGLDCASKICPNKCHNRGRCEDGICICNPGFTGPDCGSRTCPKNCSGNGQCVNGKCICDSGFTGPVCGTRSCPVGCTKHGRCVRGICVCSPGYTGVDCGSRTCPKNCNNRGRCENGVCVCDSGYTGLDCGSRTCSNNCNNQGQCDDGVCICDMGYTGVDCATKTCFNDCHGRGRCDDGVCICDFGYTGLDCGSRTCPEDCHNRGQCENGVCMCDSGYTGLDCGSRTCPKDCHNRGQCEDGVCICDSGYTGLDCGSRTCPNNCQNHGICDDGNCVCDSGYTGLDCGIRTCLNDCNNQGQCEDGLCICDFGYTGPDCGSKTCPNDCHNQGQCEDGVCVCDSGYTGLDCGSRSCPDNCNNRGTCDDGKCICDSGYTGIDCGLRACPENCHIHGRCEDGVCICHPGYTGLDCGSRACPKNCNNNGQCVNGKCVCDPGYSGPVCGTRACPGNCGGRGKCVSGTCVCKKGYGGADCGMVITEISTVTGLRVVSQEESSVGLEWDAPQTPPDSYDISFVAKKENGLLNTTVDGSLTSYVQTGLAPGEEYLVSIQPRKGQTVGPDTSLTVTTNTETPRGLRVTDITTSSMLLRWERPQSPPDRYIVVIVNPDGKERKLRVPGKGDRVRVTGLEPGTRYRIILRAEKGQKQSEGTEATARTAITEKQHAGVPEKSLSPENEEHYHPTSHGAQSFVGREDIPKTRENIEVITEDQHKTGINVVNTTRKNIYTTIITRHYIQHPSEGKVVGDHDESQDPQQGPVHKQDGTKKEGGSKEIAEDPIIRTIHEIKNLPDGKVEKWVVTRNVTFVVSSLDNVPTHIQHETEGVPLQPEGLPRNIFSYPNVEEPGKLGLSEDSYDDHGLNLDSLIESARTKTRPQSEEERVRIQVNAEVQHQNKPSHPKSPLSENERRSEGESESPLESSLEFEKSEDKGKSDIPDDLGNRLKLNKTVRTVIIHKDIITTRKKNVGREDGEFVNDTVAERSGKGVQEGGVRGKTFMGGPHMKKVIENLPEKLSMYNGTFIQRLESYLRATSYPLRGNQTVESVARAIYLYLVKWKPHSFTGMVYERLPQKTPGATGNTKPSGASRIQGNIGEATLDNSVESMANVTDKTNQPQEGAILITKGKKPSGEADPTVSMIVGKYSSTSDLTDGHVSVLKEKAVPLEEDVGASEEGTSKTAIPKPPLEKIPSKVARKVFPSQNPPTLVERKIGWPVDERGLIVSETKEVERLDLEGGVEKNIVEAKVKEHGVTKSPGEKKVTGTIQHEDFIRLQTDKNDKEKDQGQHHTPKSSTHLHTIPPDTQKGKVTKGIPNDKREEKRLSVERLDHEGGVPKKQPPQQKQEKEGHTEDILPSSEIPGERESLFQKKEEVEKVNAVSINHIAGSVEEQGKAEPSRAPVSKKKPGPGVQGRPRILKKTPTSLVLSLEGLGVLWDKVMILYRSWPPTTTDEPLQLMVNKGVRQVEIRELKPGTSYRFDLHGLVKGRSSKSYSLVADTALEPTTSPILMDMTTQSTTMPAEEVMPSKVPSVTQRPRVAQMGALQVKEVTSNSATLVWKARNGVYDSFLVRYEGVIDSITPQEISVPGNKREVTLTGLTQDTRYAVSVYGVTGGKLSRPLKEEVTTGSSPDRGTTPRLSPLSVSEVQPNSFLLSWEPLDGDFDAYVVQYGPPGGPTKEETLRGDQTSLPITGLDTGVNYTVELRGIWGESYSDPETTNVLTGSSPDRGKPPRLSPLSVSEVQPNSFLLSWKPLNGDFDAYVVQYGPPGGPTKEENLRGDQTSLPITGLDTGVNYTVELRGIWGESYSDPETTNVLTEKLQPPRLESLYLSDVRSDSVHLTWDVQFGEFDSFLLYYRDAEGRPQEITLDGDLRSFTVQDLKPGKKYKFVLYGISEGKRSKPVTAETSTEKPLPPRLDSLSVSDIHSDSVRLSWEVQNGDFDSFLLYYRDAEGKPREITLEGDLRNVKVNDLKPGKKYKFVLYGISGGKRSKAMIAETTTTPKEKPAPPTPATPSTPRLVDLQASEVGKDSVKLSWTVEGSPPFNWIVVQYREPEGLVRELQVQGGDTSTLVQGLLPSRRYKFNVYGVRGEKRSKPLSTEVETGFPEVQGQPSSLLDDLFVSPQGPHSILLSWEAPEGSFDSFVVRYGPQGHEGPQEEAVADGHARTLSITDLQPDTPYTVTLHGIRRGTEQGSLEATGRTGPLDLAPPKNLRFSDIEDTSAVVSWDPPNPETTTFKVSYQLADGGEPESISVIGASTPLQGLTPGSRYEVTVVSVRGFEESQPLTGYITTGGGGPTSLSAHDVTEVSAILRWDPPQGPVDRYIVTHRAENVPSVTQEVPGDRTELPLSGLHPHTEYYVSVQSSEGSKTSSPTSTSFTTSDDTPRDLSASQITARSALLTWKAPMAVPDGYLLSYQTPEGEMKEFHLSPNVTSFTMSRLNPSSPYKVQLRALQGNTGSAPISTSFTTGRLRFPFPRDCWEQRLNGEVQSGPLTIYIGGEKTEPLPVYCDMETDGGGWIVFQRRMDGSTDFWRDWKEYKKGFGNLTSEFWLGNIALHQLSSSSPHELRVDLRAGDESVYAVYEDFRVEAEDRRFRLRVGQYRGDAGDSLSYHNNMVFSTKDRDAQRRILPCSVSYRGAWWYRNCHYANLNGVYGNSKDHQGINWFTWKGFEFSIPFTEMKIRPQGVRNRRRL